MNYKSYIMAAAALLIVSGCQDDPKEVPLEADMQSDITEVAAGGKVCFMDRSSGNPARWDWEFEGGDPETSQLFSPEVTYNKPGTYSVKLRVGRGDRNSEKVFTEYITVAYPTEMSADFESNTVNAYNTDEVTFTDLSTGFPTQWDWTFATAEGVTVKSTEQNPVMKFEPGVYSVTLAVSSPAAKSTVTKTDYLNVIDHDAVAAEFEASTPLMILAGETVTFEDKTMGRPENWNWQFEGADTRTSTERNPTVKYSTPGRYKVTLVASNEVNSSTCEKDAYVMVLPATGLSFWFPFEGDLSDRGPQSLKLEELKLGNFSINVNAPSRHEGTTSVQLDGNTKTNSDGYAILQFPEADCDKIPGGMQSRTMVMWVKVDGSKLSQVGLFNRGRPAGAITANTADKNQSQSWGRLNKTSKASEGYIRWHLHTTGQGSASVANNTKVNVMDNQWHCLVFVNEVTGSECVTKIYVDGKLMVAAPKQAAKDTYKDPFLIGCTQQFTAKNPLQINNPMQGCIDDFMIYDYALTASEISTLYDIMK